MIRYLFILFILGNMACSRFSQIQKNPNWKDRYQAALDYYQQGDYYRAGVLFEDLLPIIRGLKEAEQAQFNHAYCYFYQRQYTMSSHYFQSFFETYANSPLAEEAVYRYAHSLYLESPEANLDQGSTNASLEALQYFINRYPQSQYAKETLNQMEQLRMKLEKKAFDNAQNYHKIGYHQAAIISLDNFRKDFPDSFFKEEAAFLMLESSYELAKMSYILKQKERFENTIKLYKEFIDRYPETSYLKKAESYFAASMAQLEALSKSEELKELSEK